MGPRSLISAWIAVAACGGHPAAPSSPPSSPIDLPARVASDFEAAVKTSRDAYVALFDFAAVGEIEILLHRYDLNGRLPNLPDDMKAGFAAEDGTPYPAERERRNVGNFYNILAQRTVGSGGCKAQPPRTRYGKLLATYDPLPDGTPPKYETLRSHALAWAAQGGVVGVVCDGGKGGLALVYTRADSPRGYNLITIYDD